MKKVPRLGFQSCQSVVMVLHSIKVLSMMPCFFVTIGTHHTYQALVSVAVLSTLIMHSPAQQVVNDLRDFTANRLTEVCPNVCIDPTLQALTGELLSHNSSISERGEMTSFFTVQHVGVDSEDICGSCNMTAVAVISSLY